jgi:aspartate/methionine/tyrosine aminotransferase
VASLYQRISSDRIVIAAPEEAIFIAMQTLLERGDEVIAVSPAYQSLHEIAASLGCSLRRWRFELNGDRWQLDVEDLERAITRKTRLVVVNFPHNPTGFLPSRVEWDRIVELVRAHGLYLFSDEMYRFLEPDPRSRLPAGCECYEKGISLSGLSKSFALPGLRIGWLATQDHDLIDRWLAYKDYTTICSSAPSEILGIIALQARAAILQRNLEIIRQNISLAGQFFLKWKDHFLWVPPLAGSVAFPRWLGPGPVDRFAAELIETHGVMIVPGGLFEFPGDHFRVGLGRRNFGEALEETGAYFGTATKKPSGG